MTTHPINVSNVGVGASGYFCKICGDAVVIWAPDEKWLHLKELPPVRMVPEIRLKEVQDLNKKQHDRIVFLRMEIADHIRDLSHKNTKIRKKHRHRRGKLLVQRKALADAIRSIEDAMDAFIDSNDSTISQSVIVDNAYSLLGKIDSAILKLTTDFPGWDNNWGLKPEDYDDEPGEEGSSEGSSNDPEGIGQEVHGRAEAGDPSPRNQEAEVTTWHVPL